MIRLPTRTFPVATVCVCFAMLACESPVGDDPQPRRGQFFHGQQAVAEVKRLLASAVQAQEILKGPEGPHWAASRGLTLDEATLAVSKSTEHYTKILEGYSGKTMTARVEGALQAARETLEVLRGPQGSQRAADLGMTLEAAIADTESQIEKYGSILARRKLSSAGAPLHNRAD